MAKIRAIRDHVLVTDMEFGEVETKSGIILSSDNGTSRGIHPRWGKVYAIGPEQAEVQVGQWVLVEHGRWTRGHKLEDGRQLRRVEVAAMMLVSDDEPDPTDILFGEQ